MNLKFKNDIEITIGNLTNEKCDTEYHLKVDRSSVLGNPFLIDAETGRDSCIAAYKEWLWGNIQIYQDNPESSQIVYPEAIANKYNVEVSVAWKKSTVKKVVNELIRIRQLNKVRLMCWCKKPDIEIACHADVISACLRWM